MGCTFSKSVKKTPQVACGELPLLEFSAELALFFDWLRHIPRNKRKIRLYCLKQEDNWPDTRGKVNQT
jgi:hypothetical protein